MCRRWLLVLAFLPACVHAQMLDVRPGAKIRLTAPTLFAGRVEATVSDRRGDSITVLTSAPAVQYTLALSSLSSLSISRGKSHGRGATKGLMWGAGFGLAFGAATSFDSTMTVDEYHRPISKGSYIGTMTLGSAMIGSLVGAIIGSEAWSSYDLPARVTIGGSGARLGSSFKF